MSTSASFWAAKSNGVKSPPAPASVGMEPTMPPTAATKATTKAATKKAATVFRGESDPAQPPTRADDSADTANGIKKSNWADSDDEEEFLASFASSTGTKELEKTVAAKDARITDLATALQEKDGRIAELERATEEQQCRIVELENSAGVSAGQLEDLKKDNHKQFLHVQKLVAEVDEKDRRIAALETEVDEHCATIAKLDAGDHSTQDSTSQASQTPQSSPPKTAADKQSSLPSDNTTPSRPKSSGANNVDAANTPAKPASEREDVSSTQAGPAVNLSSFPIFATPATVKQTAPPPPAPKLKMGVDLSKFSKKPASKRYMATTKAASGPSKPDVKDGPAPKIDPLSDIRTKRHEERVLFANGSKVQVKMGDVVLGVVPKYVLIQCSPKAFKHFSNSPDATSFTVPAGSMDTDAATAHLEWMKEMTYQGRVYSITLHSDEQFDDKNLQVCRAARVLGLNNMYVGHFTKIFCDRIRSNAASYDFLSKVATLAYPENDPIYDCLTNSLANLCVRNASKKPAQLDDLLKEHTGLKARVEKIEERMRKKQDGGKKQDSGKGSKGIKVVRVGTKMDV